MNTTRENRLNGPFVASTSIVARRVGQETILVPVSSGVGDLDAVYTLSDVGARVWTLLRDPASLPQIVDAVCREYDVAPEVAAKDVSDFLETLAAKRLVEVAPGAKS